jgi:pimeloyl-ACP methyl ester carboxylesterase
VYSSLHKLIDFIPIRVLIAAFAAVTTLSAQKLSDLRVPAPIPRNDVLVLGFLGGFERWNDEHRGVRQLMLRLRESPGVHAESLSHRRARLADRLIVRAFDRNANGKLEADERSSVRVILVGQSLGGSAALHLANRLRKKGLPVLLTVQVDSFGFRDRVIPPNVQAAANFYQHEPLTIQGQTEIRAADPAQTRILGNFQMHYPVLVPFPLPESWPRRLFGGAHARMEADPFVWAQVEMLVRQAATSSLFTPEKVQLEVPHP